MENTAKTPGYRNLIESAMRDERELVRVDVEAGVATVTMDDPASYNALSATLCYQLRECIEETLRRPDVEVLILTGCDPAFSAGGDMRLMEFADTILKEGREGAIGMWRWIRYQFGGVARALTGSDKLCIAALNGPAAGVGLAFALACDIIVASERARLVTAFAKIGLLPEVGTNWLFSRRIGHHRFMELYLSGEELSAIQAHDFGLINKVVPHERLVEEARAFAARAQALPEGLLSMAKPLMRRAADMSFEEALAMEEYAEPICFTTAAHKEAIAAFMKAHGIGKGPV